ncbi:sugar phosphate nucleotidyltransferase, partial [Marinobacter alexandrii]|uniref:sugar phosphate nucleotidyltransferase n=1 Tax=Marinobacter alexandrii TaxID=2570351 RepID=UPI0032641324
MIHPVIMAGGTGSRLWPLSRQLNPKQFLKLTDSPLSMLQSTVARLEGLKAEKPLLICNEEHRFLAAEQMRQSGHDDVQIILEPCGRNTAPAIALAAIQLSENAGSDNPLMLVLAADHLIQNTDAFQQGVTKAIPLAEQGKLVTFGIVPSHPETGYGYIHRVTELAS